MVSFETMRGQPQKRSVNVWFANTVGGSVAMGQQEFARQRTKMAYSKRSSVETFNELRFDEKGLILSVVQDRLTGTVRMVAWMNREALAQTLATGRATFFSRSRQKLWVKGETSNNYIKVHAIFADCDRDALLLLADPEGPSCHTGRETCFFSELGSAAVVERDGVAQPLLFRLEDVIEGRKQSSASKSYTRSLFEQGTDKIVGKIREEATELADAIRSETDERVAQEAADLLFHSLVGLRQRGVPLRKVIEVLANRFGTSGHTEKASRAPK